MEEAMTMTMRATHVDKSSKDEDEESGSRVLPGFRFHPTDEELVGFYLRRKVEKKPLKIQLIKQLDIYKYDPWDLPLPKISYVGEKEYYIFCLRERKYRNSVRPNRVTGSGFWKATGIDKNIYSNSDSTTGSHNCCIGLKKSLVFYKGKAGKGTKTDWMMHEFRLPPSWKNSSNQHVNNSKDFTAAHPEAEDWTLCRIFKRDVSMNSYKPHLKKKEILEFEVNRENIQCRNFQDFAIPQQKMMIKHGNHHDLYATHLTNPSVSIPQSSYYFWNVNADADFSRDGGKWGEPSSVVDPLSNPTIVFGQYS